MSRRCELTGVGPFTGNNVSKSNIKTRRRWLPNLKNKRYTFEELAQTLSLKLSTSAIKSIDKQGGITKALLKAKEEGLSPRLLKVKSSILRHRRRANEK